MLFSKIDPYYYTIIQAVLFTGHQPQPFFGTTVYLSIVHGQTTSACMRVCVFIRRIDVAGQPPAKSLRQRDTNGGPSSAAIGRRHLYMPGKKPPWSFIQKGCGNSSFEYVYYTLRLGADTQSGNRYSILRGH